MKFYVIVVLVKFINYLKIISKNSIIFLTILRKKFDIFSKIKNVFSRREVFLLRRKDREVVDHDKIMNVIKNCHCCRLGFYDCGDVYIVPLNFGVVGDIDSLTLYFHGAFEGRKAELIKKNPSVGFEMDRGYELQTANVPCGYSAKFESIIGTGKVSVVEDFAEKVEGLTSIMKQATGKSDWEFNEKMVNGVCVFKLEVESLSCKEHL